MGNTRTTNQRIKILEYLNSVKTHPTAEMVHRAVSKKLPAITLATVYRNLNGLAVRGEILRLEVNKEYRYDANLDFHQHCVCKKCGKIIDLHQRKISEYALNKIKAKDFKPSSVNIIFYGICKKCIGGKKK